MGQAKAEAMDEVDEEVEELAVQEPDGVETQPHLGVQDEPMRDDELDPEREPGAPSAIS